MKANQKITFIIFSMISLLVLSIVILVAVSYRNIGYDGAIKRANLTAGIVKDSLTVHMVNGIMDNRDVFFKHMKRLEGIKDLWIVRSDTVTRQFGKPVRNESSRDAIDQQVLETGKIRTHITETLKSATLRITIPYIASSNDDPNCLACHQAHEGEVLGAISLKFDIQEDRMVGMLMVIKILGTSAIFVGLILLFITRMIKPYTGIFDTITQALKRVHEGDYSVRIAEGVFKEDKEASKWLNEIVEKLETVLNGIEKNLTAFVHNRTINVVNDKLLTAQEIIEDIADIYNFKKTIESDRSRDDIYYRLSQVMIKRLEIPHFIIFEDDFNKNERRTVLITDGTHACCEVFRDAKEICRAERTSLVVLSDNFPELCRTANCQSHYICVPFAINDQISLTISIICQNDEELKHVKYKIGIIKKYLEEAKPILESRLLMDVLRERNFIDGLTGLYNRKKMDEFVDRYLEKELAKGSTYTVMMLDVDYFKMVNDTYGHDAGDSILQKLSTTMKDCVTPDDLVIRFGGEEFLILLKNRTEEEAGQIAGKINETFGKIVFKFNNESFSKTVSIGYASFPADTDQIWRCIKFADLSLYEAKETGRNKVVRFHKDLLKNGDDADY